VIAADAIELGVADRTTGLPETARGGHRPVGPFYTTAAGDPTYFRAA